ncbi:MAG: hypothetical protein HRF43_08740 [Phycisphaerae bacterium]|jgi:hypothetical protein
MTRLQRGWRWLAMVGCGATLYQTAFSSGYFPYNGVINSGSGGCARFAANGLATSIDFCYLLDCDNGFFGGLIDPCTGGNAALALLTDCAISGPAAGGNAANTTGQGGQAGQTGQTGQTGQNQNRP